MNVQEACEAANFNTYQMYLSLGGEDRKPKPGNILLQESTPPWVSKALKAMGYTISFEERTSGPINAFILIESTTAFGVALQTTAMIMALVGKK